MSTLLLGVGVALAIEGSLYALFPGPLRRMMQRALNEPDANVRLVGALALATGIVIISLAL